MIEITEVCPIETQQLLIELWEKTTQRGKNPAKREKNPEKKTNKQTNEKHSTSTEDIIPTLKQHHMKERLTLRNTRYIQIGRNIQEQSTRKKTLSK